MSVTESLKAVVPSAASYNAIWIVSILALLFVLKRFVKCACLHSRCCARVPQDLKLTYFDIPGRAEAIRLILAIAGIKFEDERISRDVWAARKATTPFGQLPVLHARGETLAQSNAILRYVGRLARMYPCSLWRSAKVDEIVFLLEDMHTLIAPTFRMEADAKVAARQELAAGKLGQLWAALEERLDARTFLVGDRLTVADLAAFTQAATYSSGFFDGIPKDFLTRFPRVQAHRAMVASLPQVRAFYENLPESSKNNYHRMGIDIAAFEPPAKTVHAA